MSSPLVSIAQRLRDDLTPMRVGGAVAHVYNPLTYAWRPHREYLERFGQGTRDTLIVGMNAGYFGMAQTGIPFGDVSMVRDWLRIESRVDKPHDAHPKRPILGFECARREVSGQRVWSWARDTYGTPERFFARFFVLNYCPLCFLAESGANVALDKLPVAAREDLLAACDRALAAAVDVLEPRHAIGLGGFALQRIRRVMPDRVVCTKAPHPSPANASLRGDWSDAMNRALASCGIDIR